MNKDELDHYKAQMALQEQQGQFSREAYAPQMFESVQQAQAVLVEQTNPRKVVEEIMLRLRGKIKRADGQEIKVSDSKMNEKGIESVWFLLDSHINQNTILSHLDEEEIRNIMHQLQDDLVDKLSLNAKKWEIDETDLDDINNTILINIYNALKRAEGQNEKNWLGKISVENISSAPNFPRTKKEGFWNKFKL